MTGKSYLRETIWKASLWGTFLGMNIVCSWGQAGAPETQPSAQVDPTVRELAQQVRELRSAIEEMRAEAAAYRAETAELRRELQGARAQTGGSIASQPQAAATSSEA